MAGPVGLVAVVDIQEIRLFYRRQYNCQQLHFAGTQALILPVGQPAPLLAFVLAVEPVEPAGPILRRT